MRTLADPKRAERLIRNAIRSQGVDLRGIRVLTEAASGPFCVTPLIAALAGAEKVFAVTRDSAYGSAKEVKQYTERLTKQLGVADRIVVGLERPHAYAAECSLVTNLNFVRPIDVELIGLLPPDAAVSLMWETWEFRPQDVDLAACAARGVPVLGTRETDPSLEIFRYIGIVAIKLLLEADIEVFRSRIAVVGSGPFGDVTEQSLRANGAEVLRVDPSVAWVPKDPAVTSFLREADAVVLVEHYEQMMLVGPGGISPALLAEAGTCVVHICGGVEADALSVAGLQKRPVRKVPLGYMTVTTDYVGPRPVIDLHAAGLKVGQALVRGMRKFQDAQKAIDYALANSPAMGFPDGKGA